MRNRRSGWPFLTLLTMLLGCGPDVGDLAETLAPGPYSGLEAQRQTVAEFTIHFDRSGARIERPARDELVAVEDTRLDLAWARVFADEADVGLSTDDSFTSGADGYCAMASWVYTVTLQNNGASTWYNPTAQLEMIGPVGVSGCNSHDTGRAHPEGKPVVADWGYGASLAPTNSASVDWAFDPAGEGSFSVRGWITVEAPYRATCLDIRDHGESTGDGVYWIDPDGGDRANAFQVYCDMTTDGGGWTLVLAYSHPATQNNALVPGVVPQNPATGYSHFSIAQMQSLGVINEQRLFCYTSGHTRLMHFKTNNAGAIAYFQGLASNVPTNWNAGSGFTLFADHTANLPGATGSVRSHAGETRMTDFPFWLASTYHWGIQGEGHRWECDDYPNGPGNTTLHNVWVR